MGNRGGELGTHRYRRHRRQEDLSLGPGPGPSAVQEIRVRHVRVPCFDLR